MAKTPPFLAQLFRAFAALRITQDIQKVYFKKSFTTAR
jgi:hypothetical protein